VNLMTMGGRRASSWWPPTPARVAEAVREVDPMVLVALAIDTAIAVIDAFTPIVLINLVVIGPLVAAFRSTPRGTAVVSAYALALAIYEGIPHGIFGTGDHIVRCAAIAATGILAVWGASTRSRREAAQARAALLARTTRVLVGSLDADAMLRRVAGLLVPALADRCAFDVLDGDVRRRVADTGADGGGTRPDPLAGPALGVAEVLRDGRTRLQAQIAVPDLRSALVAALIARGRTIGAVTLATEADGGVLDDDDVVLVEELARRCALAIDNARLYSERGQIAHTLQSSLMPAHLPDIPGYEVAARFHARGEAAEVGGDFFDLFESEDGSWIAVIGDVSGKGADAATITALVRYTLRTLAFDPRPPSDIMRDLNAAVLRERYEDRFCTLALARLHPGDDGRATMCVAGHPPPMIAHPDGDVTEIAQHGTALGILDAPRYVDAELTLGPGDKLVFVTDGVIETRAPGGMLGVGGLTEILRTCGSLDTVATGDCVERAILEDTRDDVAILVVRRLGDGRRKQGNEGLARSGALGRERALALRLRGGPHAPAAARTALDGLQNRSLDPADAHRARLLLSEVVTNSVVHGGSQDSADWIGLDVELSPEALRVEVRDHGPGFEPAPALPAPLQTGGRGLYLVDELADRWGVADGGRRVWFELDRQPA
jgi:serine phosphatase RsbU (regulator of sigma subunit)/anti-sigma regulatory factor (Ser/Thr protein kinase)